jgi:hypothetical protein
MSPLALLVFSVMAKKKALAVERFMTLFSGYAKAYGTYRITHTDPTSQKRIGQALTIPQPPTVEQYTAHLGGEGLGFGIIPLRDDDTTALFGAIDYDNRQMDHVKAEAKVRELKLPLVLCRSKSGGGHFYVFCQTPVHAGLLRERLAEWASRLGMSARTEIFPKQTSRSSEEDYGTFINLPYFGGDNTERWAVILGERASLETFLNTAEAARVPPSLFEHDVSAESELFEEGPPCLQALEADGGFSEGDRNTALFNAALYLKKRFPDSWEERLEEYNQSLCHPPLPAKEIVQMQTAHQRKDYGYQCKQEPLCGHCNRKVCLTRNYGIGEPGGAAAVASIIGALTRYDSAGRMEDPMWTLEVRGKTVRVSTDVLLSLTALNAACLAQANCMIPPMSPQKWRKTMNELVETVNQVVLPEDASKTGQLREHLFDFLTRQGFVVERDQMLNTNRPYREGDKVYFRLQDLIKYLKREQFDFKSEKWLVHELREVGAGNDEWKVKGQFLRVWWMTAPEDEDKKEQSTKKAEAF